MLYAIVAVLVLIADQWLKYWVTANIALNTGSMELIPGFIKLVDIHNDGATLGILSGARWFFVLLAAVFAAAVILALAKHLIKGGFGRWMAVLALAGAVGNCIDRVMFGYVVDMFKLEPGFLSWFGIFNIADIFITVCGILFCFYLIFGGKHRHAKKGSRHTAAREERKPAAEPQPAPAEETSYTFEKAAAERDEEPAEPGRRAEAEPEAHAGPKHTRDRAHAEEKAQHREPKHAARPAEPEPAAKPEDGGKPADDDMSFSLDDIMDEFK